MNTMMSRRSILARTGMAVAAMPFAEPLLSRPAVASVLQSQSANSTPQYNTGLHSYVMTELAGTIGNMHNRTATATHLARSGDKMQLLAKHVQALGIDEPFRTYAASVNPSSLVGKTPSPNAALAHIQTFNPRITLQDLAPQPLPAVTADSASQGLKALQRGGLSYSLFAAADAMHSHAANLTRLMKQQTSSLSNDQTPSFVAPASASREVVEGRLMDAVLTSSRAPHLLRVQTPIWQKCGFSSKEQFCDDVPLAAALIALLGPVVVGVADAVCTALGAGSTLELPPAAAAIAIACSIIAAGVALTVFIAGSATFAYLTACYCQSSPSSWCPNVP